MSDTNVFRIENNVLVEYTGTDADVVIPDGVQVIGESVFERCKTMKSVVIPESVRIIRPHAFNKCRFLRRVEMPDCLECIDFRAFGDCNGLADKDGYVILNGILFDYFGEQDTLIVPETVTRIDSGDMYGDSFFKVKEIVVPDSVKEMPSFYSYGIERVKMSNSISRITDATFEDCRYLSSINISESATEIGASAFKGCTSLNSITIPSNVGYIRNCAFASSNLKSIRIEGYMTEIADDVFKDCFLIEEIFTNVPLTQKMFNKYIPRKISINNINLIPPKWKPIAICTFAEENADVTSERGKNHLEYLSKNAGKLVDVALDNISLLRLMCDNQLIDAKVFDQFIRTMRSQKKRVNSDELRSILMDYQEKVLSDIQVKKPSNRKKKIATTDQADGAFAIENSVLVKYCGTEENVEIPDGVTRIGCRAFYNCVSIISVTMPESILQIDEMAFYGCENLKSIVFSNKLNSIGYGAFVKCSGLVLVDLPDSLIHVGHSAFRDCTSLSAVKLSSNLESISFKMFADCQSLTEVVIPSSVEEIGSWAFANCSSMKGKVVIPDNVEKFGIMIFAGSGIEELALPNGIYEITLGVFRSGSPWGGCQNLKHVTIPDSAETVSLNLSVINETKIEAISISRIGMLSKDIRAMAAIGFALDRADINSKRGKEHLSYIKKNSASLIDVAFKHIELLSLMCENKLLSEDATKVYLDRAMKPKLMEHRTLLMEYQAKNYGAGVSAGDNEMYGLVLDDSLGTVGGIQGKRFVVTGDLKEFPEYTPYPERRGIKAYIEANGGKLTGSVSGKTDYLICNDTNSYSSKLRDAIIRGVKVITEEELYEMVGKRP